MLFPSLYPGVFRKCVGSRPYLVPVHWFSHLLLGRDFCSNPCFNCSESLFPCGQNANISQLLFGEVKPLPDHVCMGIYALWWFLIDLRWTSDISIRFAIFLLHWNIRQQKAPINHRCAIALGSCLYSSCCHRGLLRECIQDNTNA